MTGTVSEPPIVPILGAATALFLSILIVSAIGRQATKKSFQKRAFLVSVLLLISAIVLNILLTIFLQPSAGSDLAAAASLLILSKKVQGTFDLLFSVTIGMFVLATAKPEIDSRKAFLAHLREEFPNPFLFYVFVQALAIIVVWITQLNVPTPPFPTVTKIEFPLTFLFTTGLAWLTIMVYVPFMLLSYLRRIHARPAVRRDTYMIILGVCGYAVAEFVVEIALPLFAIDGRAPGFVLEMALVGLVAYAVRERGFLEDLLVPQAEAELTTAPTYDIKRGLTYLVLEQSPEHSFEIFRDFVTHGAQGLCITRKAPKVVMEQYGLEKTPILWLSRVATQKNSIRPSPPENVALAVEHFIGVGRESVVLLDGLEYLIAHNDFQSVLALLHDLNENVSLSDSILLIPADSNALNEKEYALLRREVEIIQPPGTTKVSPRVELEVTKAVKKGR
ncbi:MAG: DUF835 domain-containing protein [Methanobacteriota archaeon]|nr:MAG: DUF835 domain-containing protein [Euryarchaeota archaeon]